MNLVERVVNAVQNAVYGPVGGTVGYESVAANAAKLHVEYTVAVVPGAGGGLPLRGVGL